MKIAIFISFLIISNLVFAQKYSGEISKEKVTSVNITKTGVYKVDNYTLHVVWDKKLSYSDNIGYYGGIKKLTIYKENRQIQVIYNIEDNIALGNIYFTFCDYNFDGYLDFTVPINCGKICWPKYYLYNPKSQVFEHRQDWDYLRIQKIDKKNKLILSQPSGNAMEDNRKIYKVDGLKLIEIN